MPRRLGLLAGLIAAIAWSARPAPGARPGQRPAWSRSSPASATRSPRSPATAPATTSRRRSSRSAPTARTATRRSSPPVPERRHRRVVESQLPAELPPALGRGSSRSATGIIARGAPDPRFGSLSILTDPKIFRTLTTQTSTAAARRARGVDTGQEIAGRGHDHADRADELAQLNQGRNSLWLQGGTRANPITDADNYGFAALRCATDNLNGDNVEWIAYPANTTGTCSVTATT